MSSYLCTSIDLITSAVSLKIIGQKEQEGINRVVAVVDMVLNILITDKSIMAERSSVQPQVSKRWTTSAFSSNMLVQKGQGKLGWSEAVISKYYFFPANRNRNNIRQMGSICQDIYSSQKLSKKFFFWTLYFPGKKSLNEIYSYSLYIFNIRIR